MKLARYTHPSKAKRAKIWLVIGVDGHQWAMISADGAAGYLKDLGVEPDMLREMDPPRDYGWCRDDYEDNCHTFVAQVPEDAAGEYEPGVVTLLVFEVPLCADGVAEALNHYPGILGGETVEPDSLARDPVAWRVKNFDDDWIVFQNRIDAHTYAASIGETVQPLYVFSGERKVK